jgi:hypothetical protein
MTSPTTPALAIVPEAMSMSDRDDWEFAGPDDAKAEIRAAVEYLLRGATGGTRGDIVQEIIAIVRQVASGLPPEQSNPLDDGLPRGSQGPASAPRRAPSIVGLIVAG